MSLYTADGIMREGLLRVGSALGISSMAIWRRAGKSFELKAKNCRRKIATSNDRIQCYSYNTKVFIKIFNLLKICFPCRYIRFICHVLE